MASLIPQLLGLHLCSKSELSRAVTFSAVQRLVTRSTTSRTCSPADLSCTVATSTLYYHVALPVAAVTYRHTSINSMT